MIMPRSLPTTSSWSRNGMERGGDVVTINLESPAELTRGGPPWMALSPPTNYASGGVGLGNLHSI
jgi:hypothetical protein